MSLKRSRNQDSKTNTCIGRARAGGRAGGRASKRKAFFFVISLWVIWVFELGVYILIFIFVSQSFFFPFFFLLSLTGDPLIIPPLGSCVNLGRKKKEIVNIVWFVIINIGPWGSILLAEKWRGH